MKKLICAAVAAAVAVSSITCIAATTAKSSKKPAVAAKGTPVYADMPKGNRHQLRNKLYLRDANAEFWRTHTLVPLSEGENDKECAWQVNPGEKAPDVPSLKGASLFIEDDHNGQWLYLFFDGGKYIRKPWSLEDKTATHPSRWIVTDEVDTDWTYFVMFNDSNSSGLGRIIKSYHVEIFPPATHATQKCTDQRPPKAIVPVTAATTSADDSAHRTCETGSGDGPEPKH